MLFVLTGGVRTGKARRFTSLVEELATGDVLCSGYAKERFVEKGDIKLISPDEKSRQALLQAFQCSTIRKESRYVKFGEIEKLVLYSNALQ